MLAVFYVLDTFEANAVFRRKEYMKMNAELLRYFGRVTITKPLSLEDNGILYKWSEVKDYEQRYLKLDPTSYLAEYIHDRRNV